MSVPARRVPVRQYLVHNPASGRPLAARVLDRVAKALGETGPVELVATAARGHAIALAESIARAESGPVDLVAVGGDGTLNEVLFGVQRAGRLEAPDGLRLAVVPAGTTNVVARSLGLPPDPASAALALAMGGERRVDVGTCTGADGITDPEISYRERPFLLACGAGFDAEVLELVAAGAKRRLGRHAYSLAALRHCGPRERGLRVRATAADGSPVDAEAASVVIGCSTFYGGRLRLSTDARPDDGVLELVTLSSTRFLPLLRAGLAGLSRDLRGVPGVRVVPVRDALVEAACAVPVHVDAEPFGAVPVRVAVLPRALTIRVG